MYTPYREVPNHIHSLKPFKGNSMEAGDPETIVTTPGSMTYNHREAFNSARAKIDYLVTSYNTPIAWHTPADGWVVPNVYYSPTTSRQQNIVMRTVREFILI